jgi:hypothetical protein
MTLSNWLTIIGLVLDIIGVIMVFKYGLPSRVKEKGSAFGGTETSDQELKRNAGNRSIEIRANVGLVFLLLGFVFQLVANFVPLFHAWDISDKQINHV